MRSIQIITLILFFGISTLFSQSWSIWAGEKNHVDHAQAIADHHDHKSQGEHSHVSKRIVPLNHTHPHQHGPDTPAHEHTHSHEAPGSGIVSFVFMDSGTSFLQPSQSVQNLSFGDNMYFPNSFLDSIFRPPILNPSIS